MSQKRIGQVDLHTGEVLSDSFVAIISPKRHNGFKGGWNAMSIQGWAIIKQFKKVTDVRVFAALMEQLDFDNMILVNQTKIAKDLEIERPNVTSAIKNLIEAGIIEQGPKHGVSCSYRLRPEIGWKGSAQSHVTALDDARKVKRARMDKARITGIV